MILVSLLLGAAAGASALDAERAFAAAAERDGQWTAFRAFAAPDATMFVPQPVRAQAWLKDRKDPPKAVQWWPTASYVSCDGSLAVNTGGWSQADGSVGYFSTVWRQKDGGWKWVVDGGGDLKVARPRVGGFKPLVAPCRDVAGAIRVSIEIPDGVIADGRSPDGSLLWWWSVRPNGERSFAAAIVAHEAGIGPSDTVKIVIDDHIPAKK